MINNNSIEFKAARSYFLNLEKEYIKKYPVLADKWYWSDKVEAFVKNESVENKEIRKQEIQDLRDAYSYLMYTSENAGLFKNLREISREELLARDQESCKRHNSMKAQIPDDLVPMPSPLEDLLRDIATTRAVMNVVTKEGDDVGVGSVFECEFYEKNIVELAKETLAALPKATEEEKESFGQYFMDIVYKLG